MASASSPAGTVRVTVPEEGRKLRAAKPSNTAFSTRNVAETLSPVSSQVKVNVPSLRGVWTQANLLHHGHALSIREAILAPGHPGLRAGERGYAVGPDGNPNTHGTTRELRPAEVDALVLYVRSIE